jgi:hypothetical protein
MTTEPTELMNGLGHLTIQDLQLLALIGQGVDNRPELVKASGVAERTVFRRVDIFRGVPRYVDGKLTGSSVPLVLSRKHPHQQGMQFFLTAEAEQLLAQVEGVVRTKAIAQTANV